MAKSFLEIFMQEFFQEILKLGRELSYKTIYFFKAYIFIDDWLKELHSVLVMIRREPSDHLMNETTKTPPIHVDSMADLFDYFGSQILRRAADGHSDAVLWVEYFRKTKISQLDIALMINYDIFRFKTKLKNQYSL